MLAWGVSTVQGQVDVIYTGDNGGLDVTTMSAPPSSAGNDTLVNQGIIGSIDGAGGADLISNTGTIKDTGALINTLKTSIVGGTGADTITNGSGGTIQSNVFSATDELGTDATADRVVNSGSIGGNL